MKLSVQIRVLRGAQLLIFKTVAPGQTVTLGPSRSDTIPTIAFDHSFPLLVAGREGYGVRLSSSLAGQITVAGRCLRVHEGLLQDPRPEPLLLRGGDHGWIHLGTSGEDRDLTLEFQVHEAPASRFAARPALDRGLLLSLGATSLVVAIALLLMAPWQYQKAKRKTVTRLKTRPAILSLTQLRPKAPPSPRRSLKRKSKQEISGHGQRKRPVAKLQRSKHRRPGAPKLLRKTKRIAELLARSSRSGQEILTSMAISLPAAARGSRPSGGYGIGSESQLSELLVGDETGGIGPDSSRKRQQLLGLPLSSLNRPHRQPRDSSKKTTAANPSREAIRKVVVAHQRTIRLCYERELISSTKPIEGRLLMRWQIDQKGKAIRIFVEKDKVGSQSLRKCIITRIRSWRFPPCDPSCTVVYPFDFFPRMS